MTAEQALPSIWLRPEHAGVGRPAQHSRAEITAAAVAIADREGLDAVSMRRVAAALGTGPASLYRYVATRDDLLDLMTDAVGAEYVLAEPAGDWLADLVALGEQARVILRRHPWLAALVTTRPVIGPNGVVLLEHVLGLLASHPADIATKLEAFAMLNGITALFVQFELAGGSRAQQRHATYLAHAAASGTHPRLARLLSQAGPQPAGPRQAQSQQAEPPAGDPPGRHDPGQRYHHIMGRILAGLLGPA